VFITADGMIPGVESLTELAFVHHLNAFAEPSTNRHFIPKSWQGIVLV
jgi:hypothetical protein